MATAGRPGPFGSPVRAKFDQYVVIWSESIRSASVHVTFGTESSAPKTYSISPAWRAPTSSAVAGTPFTFVSGATGIFRSKR